MKLSELMSKDIINDDVKEGEKDETDIDTDIGNSSNAD